MVPFNLSRIFRPAPRIPSPPSAGFPVLTIPAGVAGLFLGLPNPLLHLPALVLLYPCCLYLLARTAPHTRSILLRGWLLGLFGNAVGLYWLVYPMHDVAGMPFLLAAPAVILLFMYFACYSALAALAVQRLSAFFALKNSVKNRLPPPLAVPVLAGLAWGGLEVLSGILFTGFPWLSLSTAFAFDPVWIQTASLVGGYGLSALYAATAFLLAEAYLAPGGFARMIPLASALILVCSLLGYGLLRQNSPPLETASPKLTVIMAQGNIDQNHKWNPDFQRRTLDLYLSLSDAALQKVSIGGGPVLTLWPETAMPFYFQLQHEYASALREFAAGNKIHLAFGTLGLEQTATSHTALYNRLYLLAPSGDTAGYYDKRHLVPFGEYLPFSAELPFLRELLQGMDFSPGKNTSPLLLEYDEAGLPLGILICYESIFPSLAQELAANGAKILINISNDGWFRKSSAPLQHLAHAVLRAVEQARPILRSTNTGITAVIDAKGGIQSRIPDLFSVDTLVTEVLPCEQATLFHRLHPIPEIILAALALFSLIGYRFRCPSAVAGRP